jgi:hypothetical protein
MVPHRRLGKDSLWAKAAIDDSILRMVCEEHDLFSQTGSTAWFCQTLGKRLTFQAVSSHLERDVERKCALGTAGGDEP